MAIVDLAFRVTGNRIAADQGYELYSALCRLFPQLHGTQTGSLPVAVLPVRGRLVGDRQIALDTHSRLTLRLNADSIHEYLSLTGKTICLGSHTIVVGVPEVRLLQPVPELRSRLVVIAGGTEPTTFLESVERQLHKMGVDGACEIPHRSGARSLDSGRPRSDTQSPLIRRTLRIRDRQIVGYALKVTGLSAEHSMRLQETGIGGRRHFGCGVMEAG